MSSVTIIPPTNPSLETLVVRDIQSDFASKDYLETVYPIAYIGERILNEATHLFPRVYINDGNTDYHDVMPNDGEKGFCFFEIASDGSIDLVEEENTINLNMVFWGSFRKIDDKGYDYRHEIRDDVIKTLADGSQRGLITDISYNFEYNTVWNRYSLPDTALQQSMYPYYSFSVSFSVVNYTNVDCLSDFSITSSPSDC